MSEPIFLSDDVHVINCNEDATGSRSPHGTHQSGHLGERHRERQATLRHRQPFVQRRRALEGLDQFRS